MECHVAGTSHVKDIAAKTADLSEGDMLSFRRDTDNAYDPAAIAVYTAAGDRVGWVPQHRNAVLSRLMDAGKFIMARVSSKKAVKGVKWLDMRMKIYLKDV